MQRLFVSAFAMSFLAVIYVSVSCSDRTEHTGGDGGTNDGGKRDGPVGNGAGIFGYAGSQGSKSNSYFTRQAGSSMGDILTAGQWTRTAYWKTLARFNVGKSQYVMGHGVSVSGGYSGDWWIRRIENSGDIGPQTDSGIWTGTYDTLVGCSSGGNTFIIGQQNGDKSWFVQNVNANGKLGIKTSSGTWQAYFPVAVCLEMNDKTFVFFHSDNDNSSGRYWRIVELTSDGRLNQTSDGYFKSFYQSVTGFQSGGGWYIFGQQSEGSWFIRNITGNGRLGSETDSGARADAYRPVTSYSVAGATYIFGLSAVEKGSHWAIQEVLPGGRIGNQTASGDWNTYYPRVFPFVYDTDYNRSDDWMNAIHPIIGGRKLSAISLPGTHDSGVNLLDFDGNRCNVASSCNTTTQNTDIKGQLNLGARYFDIRPVVVPPGNDWGKHWNTGHYNYSSFALGCLGESMTGVFADVNEFFKDGAHSRELVVLKISHCYHLASQSRGCDGSELDFLKENIKSGLYNLVKCDNCKLMDMTLDEILAKGNVIALVEGLASDEPSGIFSWGDGRGDLPVYDSYSNSNDLSHMENDQISKMKDTAAHNGQLFLLSWTLTQNETDAVECMADEKKSILAYAATARAALFGEIDSLLLSGEISGASYPNIIYLDAFDHTGLRTAIYLNKFTGP